ncbi:MAG TPA: hypothetical protein VK233_05250, partial [Candidatus Dormibacteraeota bacterium]|nr:hypothetical protein [Candidatus Dormibacteraeota bacterium]
MQKRLRRLPLRRLASRAATAIRRRPRAATAALSVAVLVAIALGGSLFLVSGQPPAVQAPSGQATFTYAGGWSLAELQRHLEAGDITAISATSSSPAAGNPPDGLVVKTRDGQVVTINLSVSAGQAITALSGLGYGGLLTTEALAASRSTSTDGAPNPIAIILPLLMIAATIVLITRMSRRNG